MKFNQLIQKSRRRLLHLRLQPIRVFCFHQVSDKFDPVSMWECDWMSTDAFKSKINKLRKQYKFITIEEAVEHLKRDKLRISKYAVLTADDGMKSLMNVIPWLVAQQIPLVLFVNGKFVDGLSYRITPNEQYLTNEDICELLGKYNSFLTIQSHGWEHKDGLKITNEEFEEQLLKDISFWKEQFGIVPTFFAFPFGHSTKSEYKIVKSSHLIGVMMDGKKNVKFDRIIHRELL